MLLGDERNANVYSRGDAVLLKLHKTAFTDLQRKHRGASLGRAMAMLERDVRASAARRWVWWAHVGVAGG